MLFGSAALTLAIRHEDLGHSLIAAALLTLAIVSHHFTAMGAAAIIPDPARTIDEFSLTPASLALAIGGTTVALLGLALAGALVDRRHEDRMRLTTALNNMSQGLCMWGADGRLILCNERYVQMYGMESRLVQPGALAARGAPEHASRPAASPAIPTNTSPIC